MARGNAAEVGTRRKSPNGYLYEKTEDGWELVHRLLMEKKIGHKLSENEYVTFKDNDRTNIDINNLILRERGRSSIKRRIAHLEVRIQELTAAKDALVERLRIQEELNNGHKNQRKQARETSV